MNYEKIAQDIHDIDVASSGIVSANAVLDENIFDDSDDINFKESKLIVDLFGSPSNDAKSTTVKKLLSAAMIIANKKGAYQELPETPKGIAAVADDLITRVQNNYYVGSGQFSPEEAIDNVIDRATSRVLSTIDEAFDKGVVNKVVTEGIVSLSRFIPNIGPILGPVLEKHKKVVSAVVSKIEKPLRPLIHYGASSVANKAKSIVRHVGNKVRAIHKLSRRSFA